MPPPDGLLVVDKPTGWTSHDVVGWCRRLLRTRRVGHAGTLDPMATGVLVVGVGKATRLLGHLASTTKEYDATIRLGQSTLTDDAEGDLVAEHDAGSVSEAAIRDQMGRLTGTLDQVPSAVSAVKVDGVRSYRRVRAGESVTLPPRPVTVSEFDLLDIRRRGGVIDVDVHVCCSSGTYVRALARDLGAELQVGGHLTALRRTRVGAFDIGSAHPLEAIEADVPLLSMSRAAKLSFPAYQASENEAAAVRHGAPLSGQLPSTGPVAVFGSEGELLALYEQREDQTRAVAVFAAG